MAHPTYYKSLDGFRALAVLMVLLIHSQWLPIGWVGVQMFFVLSGFLITGILVAQKQAKFSDYIGYFYWKRSLRIWPLYFLFLALSGASYFFYSVPEGLKTCWISLVSYTYNFVRIAPQNDSNWFGHFWTLCIEEQFYLVWPFVVFYLTVQRLRRLTILLIIIGPLIRYFTGIAFASVSNSPQQIQQAVHSLATSHIDAFASGALVALIPPYWRTIILPKLRHLFFGIAATTLICGLANSWVLADRGLPPHWQALGYDTMCYQYQYVWGYTLLNLTSASLMLCLMENRFFPSLFQQRSAVYLGTISYGIYVWHLPLHYLLFTFWPVAPHSMQGLMRFFTLLALTVTVASISYFGFERFFLKMKRFKFSEAIRILSKASPNTH
jgi:peptidoglycan/LPS O-acetylase OafA/YrhL